jgi:hypothetical protein
MVAAIALGGCAPTVMAPTVPVMPGANKPFDQFAAEQSACQGYANAQVAPLTNQANTQALGGTLLTTALGAGLGAAVGGGHGAAIGAASGAVVGGAYGASGSSMAGRGIQQQYDMYYVQCMVSHGNQVPGMAPPPGAPMAPPPGPAMPPPGAYVPAPPH